jgi:caffeoyl-CoA O-methyltransferase
MAFIVKEAIEHYALEHTCPEPVSLQRLSEQTYAEMAMPQMLTGRLEGRLLKMLVQLHRPALVVEIGMFTGYSALSMAEGLPANGRIITCDVDPKAEAMAKQAFAASPYGNKIDIRMGAALDTLQTLQEPIDMAFIDADKENYINYYEAVLERMPSGGLIVLDNMLWSGKVLKPEDEETRTLNHLNQLIATDDRVESVLLTVRDGVQLVRKK